MPKYTPWDIQMAVLLNPQMIPATGGFMGAEYSLLVPEGSNETADYWLVVTSSGDTVYGPASPLSCIAPTLHRTFLPIVAGGHLKIIDCDGNLSDTTWLRETFGDITWYTGPGANLVEIACDDSGIAALGVRVESESTVVRHWPDAPLLPEYLQTWYNRGVYGTTSDTIWFPMGRGDYYFPPDGGPNCIWVHGGDMICGLGMLGLTNHTHLNVVYHE